MSSKNAASLFRNLLQQADGISDLARGVGDSAVANTLRRSVIILTVAAIDSYFHEVGAERLMECVLEGDPHDARVAKYLGLEVDKVRGGHASAHIRQRLSFKTLVDPKKIDQLLGAMGMDSVNAWDTCALTCHSRTDRLRRSVELAYDRRNQIAHEGDWDFVQLEFRQITDIHLSEISRTANELVQGFESIL